jgi:hypothetical protein
MRAEIRRPIDIKQLSRRIVIKMVLRFGKEEKGCIPDDNLPYIRFGYLQLISPLHRK